MSNTRVVFMGTPEFSVPVLEALIENYNVVAVVTQPDRVFENGKPRYSAVKEVALKNNIPVLQPSKIKMEFLEVLKFIPEVIITCAYGQIIPKEIIDFPKYGCINVHASLLPKLRGGAPIHRAIIDGYFKTGITIMYMDLKMDTGDIISQRETEISDDDNVGSLHDRLSIMGRDLLIETLPNILASNVKRIKQNNDEVTYAWNIKKEDERIDFRKSKREVFNKIRGLSPYPGAYCIFGGKVCKVYDSSISFETYPQNISGEIVDVVEDGIIVKVEDGSIIIKEVQFEGKKRMKARDWLNGIHDKKSLIGRVVE